MELYFFMCSNLHGVTNVARLVELLTDNGLILTQDYGKTADGKMGPIPYQGDISTFVENAYHNDEYITASKISASWGPRFRFGVITRLKYPEPDVPRSDYITMECAGHFLGENYNYVTIFVNFHTHGSPDIDSPYVEDSALILCTLSKILYTYLKPCYGWVDYPHAPFLTGEAIRDRSELDTLYWINYFGPQYVEKYSKEFLMSIPGWKKEELNDGGIFLQLSPQLTENDNEKLGDELKEYFSPLKINYYSWSDWDKDIAF
jgi:hypothetical protein